MFFQVRLIKLQMNSAQQKKEKNACTRSRTPTQLKSQYDGNKNMRN